MDDDADDHLQALVLRAVSSDESGRSLLGRRRRTPHNALQRRLPFSPESNRENAARLALAKDGSDAHVGRRRRPEIGDGAAGDVRANDEWHEERGRGRGRGRGRCRRRRCSTTATTKRTQRKLALDAIFRREVERGQHAQTRVGRHAVQFENDEKSDEDNDDNKKKKMDAMDEGEQKHDDGVDDDDGGPQTQTRRRERQRKNGGKHFSAIYGESMHR